MDVPAVGYHRCLPRCELGGNRDKRKGVFFESISMFTFFLLLGRFLERWERVVKRRQRVVICLSSFRKWRVTLDGDQVPVKTLKVGDQIRGTPRVKHIPADGKVLSGRVHIDESMLTGESIMSWKNRRRYIFAGTLNGDRSFELEVMTSKTDSISSQYRSSSRWNTVV